MLLFSHRIFMPLMILFFLSPLYGMDLDTSKRKHSLSGSGFNETPSRKKSRQLKISQLSDSPSDLLFVADFEATVISSEPINSPHDPISAELIFDIDTMSIEIASKQRPKPQSVCRKLFADEKDESEKWEDPETTIQRRLDALVSKSKINNSMPVDAWLLCSER
jgi:hypothetical protein